MASCRPSWSATSACELAIPRLDLLVDHGGYLKAMLDTVEGMVSRCGRQGLRWCCGAMIAGGCGGTEGKLVLTCSSCFGGSHVCALELSLLDIPRPAPLVRAAVCARAALLLGQSSSQACRSDDHAAGSLGVPQYFCMEALGGAGPPAAARQGQALMGSWRAWSGLARERRKREPSDSRAPRSAAQLGIDGLVVGFLLKPLKMFGLLAMCTFYFRFQMLAAFAVLAWEYHMSLRHRPFQSFFQPFF
jgi:hypothetical protein